MSIDVEILLAIGTVIIGIALLGGVWLTLRRPARAHENSPGTRHQFTLNPVALALHRDTLEKLMGLSQPRAGLVQEAAEGCIQDRNRRLEWAQFDHEFLSACIKRVAGSWICVPESFRRFPIKDERLLLLSEQVYLESLRRTKQTKDPMGESCGISVRRIRMPENYIRNKHVIPCIAGRDPAVGTVAGRGTH